MHLNNLTVFKLSNCQVLGFFLLFSQEFVLLLLLFLSNFVSLVQQKYKSNNIRHCFWWRYTNVGTDDISCRTYVTALLILIPNKSASDLFPAWRVRSFRLQSNFEVLLVISLLEIVHRAWSLLLSIKLVVS